MNSIDKNKFKDILIWCSNDYLGMSSNASSIKRAKECLDNYGIGSGGTRNISGTHTPVSYTHLTLPTIRSV